MVSEDNKLTIIVSTNTRFCGLFRCESKKLKYLGEATQTLRWAKGIQRTPEDGSLGVMPQEGGIGLSLDKRLIVQ